MSAWPEAIYIIKKLQKSINELADIDADIARIDATILAANNNLANLQTTLNGLVDDKTEFDKIMTVVDTNAGTAQAPQPTGTYDVNDYSVFLIESS